MDTGNVERLSQKRSNPKMNAADPLERIQARRLRIKRRIEAAKRRLLTVEDEEDTVCEEEKSLLEKQVEASIVSLLALQEEGRELVTNVQVAGESYEVKRRANEAEAKEIRLKKLEEEAALAFEKFEAINSKWEVIATYNDPLDLHHETETQKEKCMELIAQKDQLISELKAELKAADVRFVKDQIKQSEDITLLVERIDSLVKIMKRTYRNELKLIEQAIKTERKEMMESNITRWENLYKQRERDEVRNLDHRFVALNEHNELMNQIMIEHQEKFRATKISLEKDIQVLQQQLEQMKALCLLNKEKMEYNYQVLKKRDEESLLIRSQQKRRINKLQDSVTTLRRKIQTLEQASIVEEKRLMTEINKLNQNIRDIQLKAEHFAIVNNNKYNQLWKFNQESAKKLLDKILNIDRIIHEQHLGYPWEPPSLKLLTKSDLSSYQAAMEKIQYRKKENMFCEEKYDTKRKSIINNRLMQYILKAIANSAGYLVESKLLQLLKDYTEEEETLVCLDNVFSALSLKYEEDIQVFREALEPHIECKTCGADDHFLIKDFPRQTAFTTYTAYSSYFQRPCLIEDGKSSEDTVFEEQKVHFDLVDEQTEELSQVVQEQKEVPPIVVEEQKEISVQVVEDQKEIPLRETDKRKETLLQIVDLQKEACPKVVEEQKEAPVQIVDKQKEVPPYVSDEMAETPSKNIDEQKNTLIQVFGEEKEPLLQVRFHDEVKEISSSETPATFEHYSIVSQPSGTLEYSQQTSESLSMDESFRITAIPSYYYGGPVKSKYCKNSDHVHFIEPVKVLDTLRNFVAKFRQCKMRDDCTLNAQDHVMSETVSRLLKNSDVKHYWERYRVIFGTEREKLWDCLMIGLTKYHSVLQERHKINKEVEQLKVQNFELRRLLQRYALPNNIKAGNLKQTRTFLPPLAVKSPQESCKTPIDLFLQLTENPKCTF